MAGSSEYLTGTASPNAPQRSTGSRPAVDRRAYSFRHPVEGACPFSEYDAPVEHRAFAGSLVPEPRGAASAARRDCDPCAARAAACPPRAQMGTQLRLGAAPCGFLAGFLSVFGLSTHVANVGVAGSSPVSCSRIPKRPRPVRSGAFSCSRSDSKAGGPWRRAGASSALNSANPSPALGRDPGRRAGKNACTGVVAASRIQSIRSIHRPSRLAKHDHAPRSEPFDFCCSCRRGNTINHAIAEAPAKASYARTPHVYTVPLPSTTNP
jgi:hypothetical protein